jgi:ubiquinone/menaquinone biosynthesis C-methylase UbiE
MYTKRVYPILVARLGNPKPIQVLRRRMLAKADGAVLELGFGSGVNLDYYDSERITRLYALEPNKGMTEIAEKHPKRAAFHITFLDLPGEQIPLADQSIDTVVSTFTLCAIAGFEKAICGIARVLRPKGRLIFIENTLSPDRSVQRWQKLWAAPLYYVFSGLDLTRDIPAVLQAGAFRLDELHTGYLSAFPKSWTHCCWGIATRRHDLGT